MAVQLPEDPRPELIKRRRKIETKPPEPSMDEKEKAEREEAARAYSGETPAHFVGYLQDMIKVSVDAMRDIRKEQQECWDVYLEKKPTSFNLKESWQSQVTVPKPFSSVQFFLALVRKAFDPQFLSIENEQDEDSARFWQKLMTLQLSRAFSNFPINFTDATGMGAAIGQSMEMIPYWVPGRGLDWFLIEPAKIHRDPDSISRRPQSGLFWIHEEWLDYYELKQKEGNGRYVNVPAFGPGGTWGNPKDSDLSKEQLAQRRDMLWQRSSFRSLILTQEFWGTILSPRGELLLPNSTFTVAGDQVIEPPRDSPYPSLRWPGTGFSPLPHLLRFDGRSLLEGVKSLWYFMCNLMSLHADALNWIVNPPMEIDTQALDDQLDLDDYPGKLWQTKTTQQGQQVVRVIDRRSNTGDILANLNKADQMFQEGGMMTYAAQGLPGYRAEVTAREAAQNLEQSMTVVGLMGENLEDGALAAIMAAAETIEVNMTYDELLKFMGKEWADKYRDTENKTTGLRLPKLTTGAFRVSGISSVMRSQEIIQAVQNVLLPCFDPAKMGQIFLPYLEPYKLLRSIERRLNLQDEGIIVDEKKAGEIAKAQQAAQDKSIQEKQAKEEADRIAAENKALKDGAHADKLHAEGDANRAQAGLYGAQAEQAGAETAAGAGEGAPPTPAPEEMPGGLQ